jgi:3-methylfumaryl-CoA hydratase
VSEAERGSEHRAERGSEHSAVRRSILTAEQAEAYRGTFAASDPPLADGAPLPPAWEGVYFPFAVPLAELRPDGTPARDGVLPEIDLPRRMYAGEDTEFFAPLALGDEVVQTTSLGQVVEKEGSRGRLVFVDVVREYTVGGRTAVRSTWHDVFLGAAEPDAPARPPRRDPDAAAAADAVETLTPDIRQLFRFSALTFNTHLIHYDRAWAREVEGLPDLLVHGPLTRILMMDAARRRHPDRTPRTLSMTATAPVLVDRGLRLAVRTDADETLVTALDDTDAVLATARIRWS